MDRSADPSDPVLYLCDEKVEQGKKGNYMAFFPSYKFMEEVYKL